MYQFKQYLNEAKSVFDYEPERDDYLNWKDDWNKAHMVWADGTHTQSNVDNLYWTNTKGELHREDDKQAIII